MSFSASGVTGSLLLFFVLGAGADADADAAGVGVAGVLVAATDTAAAPSSLLLLLLLLLMLFVVLLLVAVSLDPPMVFNRPKKGIFRFGFSPLLPSESFLAFSPSVSSLFLPNK